MEFCGDPTSSGPALVYRHDLLPIWLDLCHAGDNRAAAKHFREAAARARRRCESHANSGAECAGSVGGVSNAESASLTFARNLRMEALAVARAGDASAAESLLKGGLREVTAIMSKEGGGNARVAAEGEGIMLSALGNLLAEQG